MSIHTEGFHGCIFGQGLPTSGSLLNCPKDLEPPVSRQVSSLLYHKLSQGRPCLVFFTLFLWCPAQSRVHHRYLISICGGNERIYGLPYCIHAETEDQRGTQSSAEHQSQSQDEK